MRSSPAMKLFAVIFSVTALPPGERKSAVFSDAMAPVVQFELVAPVPDVWPVQVRALSVATVRRSKVAEFDSASE